MRRRVDVGSSLLFADSSAERVCAGGGRGVDGVGGLEVRSAGNLVFDAPTVEQVAE